jgi:hypothetical protein
MRPLLLLLALALCACPSSRKAAPTTPGNGEPVPAETSFPASGDCAVLCGHVKDCALTLADCASSCKGRDEEDQPLLDCLAASVSCDEMGECLHAGDAE